MEIYHKQEENFHLFNSVQGTIQVQPYHGSTFHVLYYTISMSNDINTQQINNSRNANGFTKQPEHQCQLYSENGVKRSSV